MIGQWRAGGHSEAEIVTVAAQALARVDIEQGQRSAPDTAGVECENARFLAMPFESCPVPKDDLEVLGFALFLTEPRCITRRSAAEAFFAFKVELAVPGAKTHTGEIVGDHP